MRHQPKGLKRVSTNCRSTAHSDMAIYSILGQVELTKMTALVAPWESPLAFGRWGTWRDMLM